MANIIYDDENLPQWVGGRCEYPIIPIFGECTIRIRKKYKDDDGILAHELQHEKQYKRNFFHTILIFFSRTYLYKCELEAYEQQIRAYNYTKIDECEWIVSALLYKYDLNYSRSKITIDIISLLRKGK